MVSIILLSISALALVFTAYAIVVISLYNTSTKHYLRSSSYFLSNDLENGRTEKELGNKWKDRADRLWIFTRR